MRYRLYVTMLIAALTLGWAAGCTTLPLKPAPTPAPWAKELVFYDWEGDMPQAVLDAFTHEYGVEVTYLTYPSTEEAVENIRAGQVYDVVVIENRLISALTRDSLLAEIDYRNVPNFKHISPNFRDLAYDPRNKHSVPFNWGTTGLVVRGDLVEKPVTHWSELWNPRYAGKVGVWKGQSRELISLTLKSLGYSANSESPEELEAALKRLLELGPNSIFMEDWDPVTAAPLLVDGRVVIAMGYAYDVLKSRQQNESILYVLPEEGALLWGDNFTIPANSPHKETAELFVNFVLRPEISAKIMNENYYPMANDAAGAFMDPAIRDDPVIFPSDASLKNAEIVLPLSPVGEKLYAAIWERFMAAEK